MQSNIERLQTLFKRIYDTAEGKAQLQFYDDDNDNKNQEYLTHALIQSVLYNMEQKCSISYDEAHCLNDGSSATAMSLASFKGCVKIDPRNPETRTSIKQETYNFYNCITGTDEIYNENLPAYRVQFDIAIEVLSSSNPNLDALDIPQEVKDALRVLQFPIIKPYTFDEIKNLEEDNINRFRLKRLNLDTNAILQSKDPYLIQLLSAEQIKNVTEDQRKALRENEALKTKAQVLELSKQNPYLIQLLSLQEIQALDYLQISALTTDQIQALKPEQIQALEWRMQFLGKKQIQALTKDQIQALTADQMEALRWYLHIIFLTKDQISWLTEDQIQALTQKQIWALTPEQIKALEPKQIEALEWRIQFLGTKQISALTTEQIQSLKPEQISFLNNRIDALTKEQIKVLVTNILVQSYNLSDKNLKDFKENLGKYRNLGLTIKEQDIEKAFLAMKFVAKGQDFTEDHLAILESSRTWIQFIEKLVTDLLNLFRTEKQESIGGAKGKFQKMINKPKYKIQSKR